MFKRRASDWNLEGIAPPQGVALLAHLERLLPGSRGPLPDGGEPLPDSPPRKPNEIRWSPGSIDALFGGETAGNAPVAAAAAVLEVLRSKPDAKRVGRAVERLSEVKGPQQIDRLIASLADAPHLDRARLAAFSRWLCVHGTGREMVKAGVALLGVSGTREDAQLAARLGLVEELTLFAVVALQNLLPEPEPAIFELAKQVRNWGRIQAVERLDGSTDPEVRNWLLRGGAENGVMTEYLALIAARTGGLREALEAGADDELLEHAGELLRALADGGPVQAMEGYVDAAGAMLSYLRQIQDATPTLNLLDNLISLESYVSDEAGHHPHISVEQREHIMQLVAQALARPAWDDVIRASLASDDKHQAWRAMTRAERFGIDAEPVVRSQLAESPDDQFLWQWLLLHAGGKQLLEIIEQMAAELPLDAMSTGPGDDLGLGKGYEAEGCLGQALQALVDSGTSDAGWQLVRVGLNNRVIRNRNIALRVLEHAPRESWPSDMPEILRALLFREPNEDTRKKVRELLD